MGREKSSSSGQRMSTWHVDLSAAKVVGHNVITIALERGHLGGPVG